MAKFRFKLEALLEHRQMVEKEKQRRVAQIQQEIQLIQRQIQDAQVRIAMENRTLGTKELTGRLDMTYIATEKKYVGNLQVKIIICPGRRLPRLSRQLAGGAGGTAGGGEARGR